LERLKALGLYFLSRQESIQERCLGLKKCAAWD